MKVVIKCTDMPEKMQIDAVSLAVQAEYNNKDNNEDDENNTSNKYREMAMDIKKEFDRKYKTVWHCIVGENFGSFITHEKQHFIFFSIDNKSILLFKSA